MFIWEMGAPNYVGLVETVFNFPNGPYFRPDSYLINIKSSGWSTGHRLSKSEKMLKLRTSPKGDQDNNRNHCRRTNY